MSGEGKSGIAMAEESRTKRKIMIAVDESQESIHAVRWALEKLSIGSSHLIDDVVILLHVQAPPAYLLGSDGSGFVSPGFYITPESIESMKKYQDDISDKVLLQAKHICDEKKVCTEMMIAHGDARDAICEAVEKLQVAYLVLGSHGYGAIKRAFLGSVSDYCVHNAKCPVVIVKM